MYEYVAGTLALMYRVHPTEFNLKMFVQIIDLNALERSPILPV